jgi:hypothetical protein
MRVPPKCHSLVLLSCLLTVAASGDDFCLVRLAFPAPLAGTPALPLDDPNTDFVAATDSSAGDLAAKGARGGPGASPRVPPGTGAGPFAPPPLLSPAARPLCRAPLHAPLRC